MSQSVISITSKTQDHSVQPESDQHIAHFYTDDYSLATSLLEYMSVGIYRGETCIAIATPETLIKLNKGLRAKGLDLSRLIGTNQYVAYDAEELLSQVMQGKLPSPIKFLRAIKKIMSLPAKQSLPIRVFGEMVTILLRESNLPGLMLMEKYWNECVREYSLSLYCPYPTATMCHSPEQNDMLHQICDCHTLAIDSPSGR